VLGVLGFFGEFGSGFFGFGLSGWPGLGLEGAFGLPGIFGSGTLGLLGCWDMCTGGAFGLAASMLDSATNAATEIKASDQQNLPNLPICIFSSISGSQQLWFDLVPQGNMQRIAIRRATVSHNKELLFRPAAVKQPVGPALEADMHVPFFFAFKLRAANEATGRYLFSHGTPPHKRR